MEDDEDDLYGSGPVGNGHAEVPAQDEHFNGVKQEDDGMDGQQDDEDEDDEDSESDIDIITERKDAPAAPATQEFKRVKQEPVRIASGSEAPPARPQQQSTTVKTESTTNVTKLAVRDGSRYPEYRSSTIDLHNVPIYDPAGKPITEVDLDADIAMTTKPWRVPGTDPTDFFNYGFDEFTWVQYCMKQNSVRDDVNGLKNETKQFEAMLSGQPQAPSAGQSMMGMPDMNPEMMNAMFGSMQAQGMDPSQLDFGGFMQQMQQMGGMPAGMQNFGGANQGFGNQQAGQSPFNGGFGGGTPQPQQQGVNGPQSYDGFSQQQVAMMQQQQGGGRGRGRGRRW